MYWAIGAAGVAALADWAAVASKNERVESFAKVAVMLGLIAAVVASDDLGVIELLLITALVMSLLGDVLLLPQVDHFIGGLGAFLIGHVFYALTFLAVGVDPAWAIPGAAITFVAIAVVGRRIVEGATLRDETLGRAVLGYILVISLMVTLGTGVSVLVAIGAVLFAASDSVLGWNRFVAPLPHGRLATHIPYHVGQGLIVLGVLTR
jgi:uncharacterized membrane protein YhhN